MDNSNRNFVNGETREEINQRIKEVANPEDIPGLSKIQRDHFLAMGLEKDPIKRERIAKQMQKELTEKSSRNVNSKLA